MVPRIIWPRRAGEPQTPFSSCTPVRSLRLTLHSASFTAAAGEEKTAVEILREFAGLELLDILEENSLQFDQPHDHSEVITVRVQKSGGEHLTWIYDVRRITAVARRRAEV